MELYSNIKNKLNYFGDRTSLHGIQNVFSTSCVPYLKRLFWSSILLSCCVGSGSVLQSALKLFSTGVASYSVETNYLDWASPFPAVTVCDASKENSRTQEYLRRHKKSPGLLQFYKDIAYWNVLYCSICRSCRNDTCEEDFQHGVQEIRYKCSELLTDCWWGGKYFRCCDIFYPAQTEFGECYVFNSVLLGNASILTVNKEVGLPYLLFSAVKIVSVTVHAPDDMISISFENILGSASKIPLITEFEAILKETTFQMEQTVNDASVVSLPVSMRGCLFKDEKPSLQDWPFQQYTYSACLMYCRRVAQIAACNCTHHFMSAVFGTPACDIKGLNCLSQNKDDISAYACDCPTACDETQYKVVHIFFNRVPRTPDMIKRGTRAKIRFANLPSLRVRRLAIKDTLGLVVDIGGVGGVFFGASLLSIFELFYLLFIRRN